MSRAHPIIWPQALLAPALAEPQLLSDESWRALSTNLVTVLGSLQAPAFCGLAEAMAAVELLTAIPSSNAAATALAEALAHEVRQKGSSCGVCDTCG